MAHVETDGYGHDGTEPSTPRPVRQSIEPTFDSRDTGHRYHVTTRVGDKTIAFQDGLADPFVRQTVHLAPDELLDGLNAGGLDVVVIVGGDGDAVDDVLELDSNTLLANSTRRQEFDAGVSTQLKGIANRERNS